MNQKTKNPTGGSGFSKDVLPENRENSKEKSTTKPSSIPKKSEAVLQAFIDYKNLNTFQAQGIYGDSCLHTSVSDLKRDHGIIFYHEWESVINRVGRKVRVVRYHLVDHDKAKVVFRMLQKQRGLHKEVA